MMVENWEDMSQGYTKINTNLKISFQNKDIPQMKKIYVLNR